MIFKSLPPSPALHEFVRNYTILHLKFNSDHAIPLKQRPPKPEQGIVFYVKGSVKLLNLKTGSSQTPAPVSVFCQQTDKKSYYVTSEFFIFTIFLRPGMLHRLIGMPLINLHQDFHDAEMFFGSEVRIISEQLKTAADYSSMITVVENYLIQKFKPFQNMSNSIDNIANHLLTDPSTFSLDWLAKQACLSTRQFHRKFLERMGISPKLFSRIIRFNHAYHYKITHPNNYWSSIAQEFNYTDYHHLEKEFKEFTGLTPNEWIKENQASPERILRLK